MITYSKNCCGIACCNSWMLRMPCVRVPLLFGLFSATVGVSFEMLTSASQSKLAMDDDIFTSLNVLVSFLVVFRTGQAYNRFWEGTSLVHRMMGDWFDAASTAASLCKLSNADSDDVVRFEQTLVRLISLLNAMCMAELEGPVAQGEHLAFHFDLLDVETLDVGTLSQLNGSANKAEIAFQWIQTLLVHNISLGVLDVPAPLLTRVFQEFGVGMLRYHDAIKLVSVPLPFPYTAIAEVLLFVQTLLTPILMASLSDHLIWIATYSFIQTAVLWSLHFIASELENPFEGDVNDLSMRSMQFEMNNRLRALLSKVSAAVPGLVMHPEMAAWRLQNMSTDPRSKVGDGSWVGLFGIRPNKHLKRMGLRFQNTRVLNTSSTRNLTAEHLSAPRSRTVSFPDGTQPRNSEMDRGQSDFEAPCLSELDPGGLLHADVSTSSSSSAFSREESHQTHDMRIVSRELAAGHASTVRSKDVAEAFFKV